MTRYGYILPAHALGVNVVEAIREHPTTRLPDVAPVWARWNGSGQFVLDWHELEKLRAEGIEPVVYAETEGLTSERIRSGFVDNALRLLAARSRGAAIRWLHEGNGQGQFLWQRWSDESYRDAFAYGSSIFHEEGARVIYCVSARGKRDDDLLDRYPGDEYVDIVAFDEFRRKSDEPLPPDHPQITYTIERLASTGKPVWQCEGGAIDGVTWRAVYIHSYTEVQGLDAALWFDYRIVAPKLDGTVVIDNWEWNAAMRRAWDRLPT